MSTAKVFLERSGGLGKDEGEGEGCPRDIERLIAVPPIIVAVPPAIVVPPLARPLDQPLAPVIPVVLVLPFVARLPLARADNGSDGMDSTILRNVVPPLNVDTVRAELEVVQIRERDLALALDDLHGQLLIDEGAELLLVAEAEVALAVVFVIAVFVVTVSVATAVLVVIIAVTITVAITVAVLLVVVNVHSVFSEEDLFGDGVVFHDLAERPFTSRGEQIDFQILWELRPCIVGGDEESYCVRPPTPAVVGMVVQVTIVLSPMLAVLGPAAVEFELLFEIGLEQCNRGDREFVREKVKSIHDVRGKEQRAIDFSGLHRS